MPLPQPTNWHGWQDSRERRKHGGNKVTFRSCRRPFGSGRTAAKRCRGGNAHGNRLRTGGRCQKSGGSAADLCSKRQTGRQSADRAHCRKCGHWSRWRQRCRRWRQKLAERFWPGPLTMILPKRKEIPEITSGGLDTVGIRMPSHPVARALIQLSGVPIAAPSANISGYPSPTTAQHVMRDMQGKIAAVVDGGACSVGVESTVIALEPNGTVRILRPGFVTKEMLEEVAPEVTLDPAILHQLQEGQTVRSPGMKYQHYSSPCSRDSGGGQLAELCGTGGTESGRRCLCTGVRRGGNHALPAMSDLRKIRQGTGTADFFQNCGNWTTTVHRKCTCVLRSRRGIGLAVYNRLIRAAGFEVIQV